MDRDDTGAAGKRPGIGEVEPTAFARQLSGDWEALLAERVRNSANPDDVRALVRDVAPLLVEALTELCKVVEQVDEQEERARQQRADNPAFRERRPFSPVAWLAAYLIRNNPRGAVAPLTVAGGDAAGQVNAVTQAYAEGIRECLDATRR